MLEIILTRHGETQWNIIRRMQGQANSPLSDLGESQAEWLGKRLLGSEIDIIYASPLGRAHDTAEKINRFIETDLVLDDRLMEIDVGPWQGLLIEDIERDEPELNQAFWHDPKNFYKEGVESFEAVQIRGGDFIEEIIEKHSQGRILVVAHAIILKGILNHLKGQSVKDFWDGPHILPTSVTRVTIEKGEVVWHEVSDTSHYEKPMTQGWFIDEEDK